MKDDTPEVELGSCLQKSRIHQKTFVERAAFFAAVETLNVVTV